MALFDFLSGSDDAERAAAANRAAALTGFQQSGNVLGQYQAGSLGALGEGLTSSTGALTSNLQAAIDAYKAGTGAATGYGQQAVAAFDPVSALATSYGKPVGTYYDALGVNGPEGTARAQNTFTSSHGYQFAVDEATKAAANKAASLGIAGSGNTLDEIRNRAQGFAKQDYGSWLDRLGAFAPMQLTATTTAAGGQAGGYKNLADIATTGAGQVGNTLGTLGTGLAGLYTGDSQNRANVLGNVAQGQLGSIKDLTGVNLQANNMVAQQGAQDAANFWNFLGNAAGAAGKAFAPRP
jgi:hypothetical protein